MSLMYLRYWLLVLTVFGCLLHGSRAQPARTWVVAQQHPQASDSNPGTAKAPFATISKAAELAGPGDTVWVEAGIYRERVAPARGGEADRPVLYLANPRAEVVVKGSEAWKGDWQPYPGAPMVFSGTLPEEWLEQNNPFLIPAKRMEGHKTLGQVFVEGRPYAEVNSVEEVSKVPGSWKASADGKKMYIHFLPGKKAPQDRLVEVSIRDRIFAPHRRGLGYITVRNFTFEHCANQFPSGFWKDRGQGGAPQAGAVGFRSGHHWVFEYNTIRFAKTVGLDCGSEGGYDLEGEQPRPDNVGFHLIRYNEISDNGACGIAGYIHRGTRIVGNLVERNNRLGWGAPEVAGIKVHYFINGLIEGNIVRDNQASGIWVDNVYHNSRVTRNVCTGNGIGIFMEMGHGPAMVDNNILAFNGEGVYTHDASGVTVAHNLFYLNRHFGVYMRTVTDRRALNLNETTAEVNWQNEEGWMKELDKGTRDTVATCRQTIVNNIFIDNHRGPISLPLPGHRAEGNISDYNLYVNGTQWHWEGLNFDHFVLTGEGVSEKENGTLEYWRRRTGWDANSLSNQVDEAVIENGAVQRGKVKVSQEQLFFELQDAPVFQVLKCPKVEGIDSDYYGNPLPDEDVLPGPFQIYREGYNQFFLFPKSK